jgi:hypothetical protein
MTTVPDERDAQSRMKELVDTNNATDGEKSSLIHPSSAPEWSFRGADLEDALEVEGTPVFNKVSDAADKGCSKRMIWCLILGSLIIAGVAIPNVLSSFTNTSTKRSNHESFSQASFADVDPQRVEIGLVPIEPAATAAAVDEFLNTFTDDEWLPDEEYIANEQAFEELFDFTPGDMANLAMQIEHHEESLKDRRLTECPASASDVNNIHSAKATIACAAGHQVSDSKVISAAFKVLHKMVKYHPEDMCDLIKSLQKLISMNWSKASTSLILGIVLHAGSVKCVKDEFRDLLTTTDLIELLTQNVKSGSPLASGFQKTKEALIVLLLAEHQGSALLMSLLQNHDIVDPLFNFLALDINNSDEKGGIACAEIALGYTFVVKTYDEKDQTTAISLSRSLEEVLCGESVQNFVEAGEKAAKRLKCKKRDWPTWSAMSSYLKCSEL